MAPARLAPTASHGKDLGASSGQGSIPRPTPRALTWLDQNWPFAGTVVVVFLVALLPVLLGNWSTALVLLYAQLIIYQLHQIEEHYADRFRRFVNEHMVGGADALTPRAVMWINVIGVWALYALILVVADSIDIGLGLIAVYTTLVNGLAHIGMAVALRRANPGLWTSLGLFLPIGLWAWVALTAANGLGAVAHVVGLAVAVLVHVVIIAVMRTRLSSVRRARAVS